MKKYPKIHSIGDDRTQGLLYKGEIIITEKMDGSNFRTKRYGNSLLFGSRNVEYKEQGEPMNIEEIDKQFQEVVEYLTEEIDIDKLKELEKEYGGLTLFGENMIEHTITYDWTNTPQILGFDIWLEDKEEWLSPLKAKEVFNELGLKFVPIVDSLPVSELDPDMEIPGSKYRDGKAEGVVFTNTSTMMKAKLRTEEFKEKMKQSKKSNNKQIDMNTVDMVNTYCPNHRITKMINKLVIDEDKDLAMDLMNELPMKIVDDIFEEEYKEIVRSNKTINFKDFRSMIAKRCVSQLRDRMKNSIKENKE